MRTVMAVLSSMVCVIALSVMGAAGGGGTSHAATQPVAPRIEHRFHQYSMSGHAIHTVWVIMLENLDWSAVLNSASAPYINGTVLPMAALADGYYTPPGLHPSLVDYLWVEMGQGYGIPDDTPAVSHQGTTVHLVTLLHHARISWKTYQESIDGRTCPLTDSYPYTVHHNPFVYFDDVTNDNDPQSAYCIAHVRPYRELAGDLTNHHVAHYNFITPNLCHDMHDSCAPVNDPIKQGDTWLSRQVPTIMSSAAYKAGGAIFITWDEGSYESDGPLGMIVLSPYARHGYVTHTTYTHTALLRTLQDLFGVRPYLGDAQSSTTNLSALFTQYP